VQRRAREAGAVLAYCNLVGGQDELVFDGDSILVSADGEPLARGPQFEKALIVADLELPSAVDGPGPDTVPELSDIQSTEGGALPETSGAGEAVDAGDGTVITIERVALDSRAGVSGDDAPTLDLTASAGFAVPADEGSGDTETAANAGAAAGSGTDALEAADAGPADTSRYWPGPGGIGAPRAADDAGPFWPRLDDVAEVYAALVLGTADYVRKNGFRSVLLSLSGGIDSALVAAIAADEVGPENVSVILMPGKWSSGHSVSDAEDLVARTGVQARTVAIQEIVDAFCAGLDDFPESGLPAENLQSRVRGVINMAVSNNEGQLVLTAGNKSEIACGYSTLYGDSAGGFGVIKDVFKTLVWDLSRWRNAEASRLGLTPPIPENSITKPPSAELAPGQVDTDSLPSYEVLDALLDDYVEKDLGSAQLIAAGHDPALVARVIRLVDLAEYKRRQYPPGPKISQKNFGRDRRLPITNRWRESL
jgi:NAD+ synthase (glutamine-hydrolysing)